MFRRPIIITAATMILYVLLCTWYITDSTLIALVTVPIIGIVTFAIAASLCYIVCRKEHKEINHCTESIQQHVIRIHMIQSLASSKCDSHVVDSNYQIQPKSGG